MPVAETHKKLYVKNLKLYFNHVSYRMVDDLKAHTSCMSPQVANRNYSKSGNILFYYLRQWFPAFLPLQMTLLYLLALMGHTLQHSLQTPHLLLTHQHFPESPHLMITLSTLSAQVNSQLILAPTWKARG